MVINDVQVTPTVNVEAKQFTVSGIPVAEQSSFVVDIFSGVRNPDEGPYSYEYLQIEFFDSYGYSIDKITSASTFITVNCTENCATCAGFLSACSSCA